MKQRVERRRILLALPGIGALLAPVGGCPACWPVYASLLAFLGLGFLLETAYLFPIAIALLGFALAPLAHGARSTRRYWPLVVGIAGAGLAVVGKFLVAANFLLYAGLTLLAGACLWNSWSRKSTVAGACANCAPHLSAGRTTKENSR